MSKEFYLIPAMNTEAQNVLITYLAREYSDIDGGAQFMDAVEKLYENNYGAHFLAPAEIGMYAPAGMVGSIDDYRGDMTQFGWCVEAVLERHDPKKVVSAQKYYDAHIIGQGNTEKDKETRKNTGKSSADSNFTGEGREKYNPVNSAASRLSGVSEQKSKTGTIGSSENNEQIDRTHSTENNYEWEKNYRAAYGSESPAYKIVKELGALLLSPVEAADEYGYYSY